MILDRKVVVALSQDTLNFALNFATLFQCAIAPLKSKNQTESVNALLINSGSKIISTASGSNYVTGKRAIPDDYRFALVSLSTEELAKRLTYIGIFEYDRMCNALLRLVKCAKIPQAQRERLIDAYEHSEQIEFIKSVIRTAADCKEATQLSNTDIDHLAEFASVESAAEFPNGKLTADAEIKTDTDNAAGSPLPAQNSEDKYDHSWITEYASQNLDTDELKNRDFFGSPVVSIHQELNMPYDFPKLLCGLTPMVKGDPIEDFTVDEFMECMSISNVNSKITAGSIEYLKLTGQAKGIVKFILGLNLKKVSDVAFLMAGRVKNRYAEEIKNAIRTASNQNVNCIRAMWYDEKIPEIEVTVIMHVCPEKAEKQSSYEVDKDGVKILKHDFRAKEKI